MTVTPKMDEASKKKELDIEANARVILDHHISAILNDPIALINFARFEKFETLLDAIMYLVKLKESNRQRLEELREELRGK
jgi:hypothetical protein